MNTTEIFPKISPRMKRIQKIVRVIGVLIWAAALLLIVCVSFFLADFFGLISNPGVKVSFSPMLTFTSPFKIPALVLCAAFLRAGLFLAGIFILDKLLRFFAAGNFFTAHTVHCIKLLGCFVIGDWIVTKILDAMAGSGILFTFGQLVLGLLIVLIAWIMDEGRKIQEEQELTV
jgi:hypothetical protein